MRHWTRTLMLSVLMLINFGDGSVNGIPPLKSQSTFSKLEYQEHLASTQSSIQIAKQLGQRGECRAVKQETPIYSANSIRSITGIYLNRNDVVQLLENSRRGERFIAIYDPQRNISGYVETSKLELCSPIPVVVSGSRCEIIRETNLYSDPGFDSNKREFLQIGDNVEVDPQSSATVNNYQWIYIVTNFGDSGWIIVDSLGCR